MTSIETRAAAASEIRAQGDGMTLDLLAVKFNVRDEIGDVAEGYGFYETFAPTAFDETIRLRGAGGIRLLGHHDSRSNPVGVLQKIWTDSEGLHATARLSDTQAGREVATLVRDGALTDVSIGFRPIKSGDQWSRDRKSVTRTEVALSEISIVNRGALKDSKIVAARAQHARTIAPEQAARRLRLLETY